MPRRSVRTPFQQSLRDELEEMKKKANSGTTLYVKSKLNFRRCQQLMGYLIQERLNVQAEMKKFQMKKNIPFADPCRNIAMKLFMVESQKEMNELHTDLIPKVLKLKDIALKKIKLFEGRANVLSMLIMADSEESDSSDDEQEINSSENEEEPEEN